MGNAGFMHVRLDGRYTVCQTVEQCSVGMVCVLRVHHLNSLLFDFIV